MKNKLKQLREAARLTQEQLAERVGLTGPAVSLHENGRRSISSEQAAAYCKALNVESIF
jgi:DNA-binding XRE family transcriptional regulator